MDTITITATASGYVGDGLVEKNITREKVLEKVLPIQDLDETDLKKIVFLMTSMVRSIKKEFPDERMDVFDHTDNRLEEINFLITVRNLVGDVILEYNEKEFFELAAQFDAVASHILDYVAVTDDGEEGYRLWCDEEIAAGTYAICALARHDKKWIPQYIHFLRTNDLAHEADQTRDIDSIINAFGWCQETVQLAAVRLLSCCGQCGLVHFNALMEEGLSEFLKKKENRALFFNHILDEFEFMDSTEDGKELLYEEKDYYLGWRAQEFSRAAVVLKEGEMNQLLHTVERRWDLVHRRAS